MRLKKFDDLDKKTYRPPSRWGYIISTTHVVCKYCSYRHGLNTKYLEYENTENEWIFISNLKKEHRYLHCELCRRFIF